jgi:hypothetical protein
LLLSKINQAQCDASPGACRFKIARQDVHARSPAKPGEIAVHLGSIAHHQFAVAAKRDEDIIANGPDHRWMGDYRVEGARAGVEVQHEIRFD